MIKLLKDSLYIAGLLALVLVLLFLVGILSQNKVEIKKSEPEVTGGAVVSGGSTGFLEVLFFVLILVMVYLIYRSFKKPSDFYEAPKPVERPSVYKAPEPKVIPPKPYEPVFRQHVRPARQVYVERAKVEEHHDTGVHEELTNIRKMISGGEHDIARKRFTRLKK